MLMHPTYCIPALASKIKANNSNNQATIFSRESSIHIEGMFNTKYKIHYAKKETGPKYFSSQLAASYYQIH